MTTHPARRTWIDACADLGRRHAVAGEVLGALEAFVTPHPRGGPPPPAEPPWPGAFEDLEAQVPAPLDVAAVSGLLAQETGGGQPALFARRLAATEAILVRLGSPAARILRVGLRMRLRGIEAGPRPRLRRVRALADFYYSLAARLQHPAWAASHRHLGERVAGLRWRAVRPGLEHGVLDGLADGMPIHVNLLRVDPRAIGIHAAELGAATRKGASFAQAAGPRALAGISGGYFLYSEDDIDPPSRRHDPVGLLVVDGMVRSPPVFARAALLAGPDGQVALRVVGLHDVPLRVGGRPARLRAVANRAHGPSGPAEPSVAVVGDRVVATGRGLAVPLNGYVATFLDLDSDRVEPGARVAYEPPPVAGAVRATAAVAGGPMLVRAGRAVLDMRAEQFWGTAPPITFSQDETGDRNLLARLAVGLDDRDRLLVAAVDGRNVERALGMTLADVSRLMILLGCHTAINLDGGSSKRMFVDGRVVDLPSTEIVAGEDEPERVRPVHSALLFVPRA